MRGDMRGDAYPLTREGDTWRRVCAMTRKGGEPLGEPLRKLAMVCQFSIGLLHRIRSFCIGYWFNFRQVIAFIFHRVGCVRKTITIVNQTLYYFYF